ncbi:MAG: iron-containing alcohol dehydrogenase [Desulfobacterales bacterium]|nr:iron-containing alcohol dehydrogenase [Desulfobacterales bacterium]
MRFEFATARRIVFGPGTLSEVASMAVEMGRRPLVVTGQSGDRAVPLMHALEKLEMEITRFQVLAEPTIDMALGVVQKARQATCDLVIGIGGGSVIDTGKVAAALITNSGQLMDYLEIIGNAQPLECAAAPYIAIPTTAGTGSEVTRNAVLGSPEHRVKISMRSPFMLPDLAVVDPELTVSLPPSITASTGLDALTQLMEAFVSSHANAMTDGICREGLLRAAESLQRVYENGSDRKAREDMCLASLFSGFALANAKLGAVHGIAGPLGGMVSGAHGAICAGLLPYVMEMNIKALRTRAADSPALERYNELACILTQRSNASAKDAIAWVKNLCQTLQVESLAHLGLNKADLPAVVAKSQISSSMQGNPIRLTEDELMEILHNAL